MHPNSIRLEIETFPDSLEAVLYNIKNGGDLLNMIQKHLRQSILSSLQKSYKKKCFSRNTSFYDWNYDVNIFDFQLKVFLCRLHPHTILF